MSDRIPPSLPQHYEPSVAPVYNQNVRDNTYPIYPDTVDDAPFNGHNKARDSFSDTRFIDNYEDDPTSEKVIYKQKKRRSCIDRMCCGCCTCCPKWLRWCTCILFLLLIILCIIVGVFAATFKVPEVDFTGLESQGLSSFDNGVVNTTFNVGISVNNPNSIGLTFEKIEAKAYYPEPYRVQVGGGEVRDVKIATNDITHISFPFTLTMDIHEPHQQGALIELATRCADGSSNIRLDYDVYPTVRIIGIPITPKISQSMNVPCPISSDQISTLLSSFGTLD